MNYQAGVSSGMMQQGYGGGGNMMPQQGGMMPQQGGMMPQQGGMMPQQQGGMMQQHGGIMQQQGGMMQQQGGMGGMGMGVSGGMERVFPGVKLRGLPFDVTEDDIATFLGCEPVDILMVRRDGRLSGEAHVVLATPMHVEMACSKNRTYLGRRYIEIYRTKKLDYYKAVSADVMNDGGIPRGAAPMGGGYGGGGMGGAQSGGYGGGGGGMGGGGGAPDSGGSTILKLRGLPFSVSDEEIVMWFADPSLGIAALTTDNVFIVQEHGRPSGVAFVEFPTSQEASSAMAKNKQMMGSRYVEIFSANRADLEKYRSAQ